MSTKQNSKDFRKSFERGVLRSAFKSLFWAVITERKKQPGGYRLADLAKATSTSKHEVSRWFNGDPNWTINTIASIADALDVDIQIQAKDRATGAVFTPAGIQTTSSPTPISIEGHTFSAPAVRNVRLTKIPDDMPVSVVGFESAA